MNYFLLRRIVDVAVVVTIAPVIIPVCLCLMIFIKRDDPGGALFVQSRVGRHQVPFRLIKLRTMAISTDDRPSHEVSAACVTRVGHVLRRTKLDELPQLWNILRGDMTFVGPRPCLPSQRELIDERERRELFEVLPGITGPAQILGIDMGTPVLLAKVEANYFVRATPLSDLKIILQTLLGAGRGDVVGRNR
jgi:O-antigen biosynthesis protein WbqP